MRDKMRKPPDTLFEKRDDNPFREDGIYLVVPLRNEKRRLPFFIDYYRNLGVDEFFLIDNDSSDGCTDGLELQKDIHVLWTDASYTARAKSKGANANRWMNQIMNEHGVGRWGVMVDADEFLVYPGCESHKLQELGRLLDRENVNALNSTLVDLYSKEAVLEAHYEEGQDPMGIAKYFDGPPIDASHNPRARAIKLNVHLGKCCFIKGDGDNWLTRGHHFVKSGVVSEKITGAVLHPKYTSDYFEHVKVEGKRKVYYRQGKFKRYMHTLLKKNKGFTFYYEGSVEYQGPQQLVDLSVMSMDTQYA